uniref:Methyltransferase n=1 Tax=Panagrellus redivivus TaxID=6233 RepID=A0A7E4W5W9_PANRE
MRELALPIEAYHLQIADIDETLNLNPAMFDILIGNVTVLSNGDLTYKDEYKYLITEHTLIRPCEIFIIGNGSTDHAYDLLQKALLRCIVGLTVYAYYFYFDKVIVDKECVDLIKSLCTRKGQLLKFENCTVSEDVTINMMAGLDLYLKNCNIQKCFFTDMEEFLNKKDSKQILFIDHDENELFEMFDYNIVNVFGFKKLVRKSLDEYQVACL